MKKKKRRSERSSRIDDPLWRGPTHPSLGPSLRLSQRGGDDATAPATREPPRGRPAPPCGTKLPREWRGWRLLTIGCWLLGHVGSLWVTLGHVVGGAAGGVREAYKHKGEEYKLIWPDRPEVRR
eukprot:1194183-Prorocentrum_minimum.AAC.7